MCALLLRPDETPHRRPNRLVRGIDAAYGMVVRAYARSLDWALASKALVMLILLAVIGLNVYLYAAMPKGFFPQQDNGQINAGLRADQSISSQALGDKLREAVDIIRKDGHTLRGCVD